MITFKRIKIFIASGLTLLLLLSSTSALSATTDGAYTCGSYGGGDYTTGCTTPAANASGSNTPANNSATTQAPTAPTTGEQILLNDFSEYAADGGKQLSLGVTQIVNFNIVKSDSTTEPHSVTVKEVGADYVVVTIASKPVDARLTINETKEFDVTEDAVNDIEITLNSITDGKANLTFKQLGAVAVKTPAVAVTAAKSAKKTNYWLLGISGLILAAGVGLFFVVLKRTRNTSKNDR